MRRYLLAAASALSFVVATAACGGADVEDALDHALRKRADEVMPKNERIEELGAVARRGEAEHAFRIILDSGRCYVIASLGEAKVRTIDLRVFDPLGASVGKAKAPDPRIELCAKRSGPYRVVLDVAGRGEVRAAVFAAPTASGGAAKTAPTASAAVSAAPTPSSAPPASTPGAAPSSAPPPITN